MAVFVRLTGIAGVVASLFWILGDALLLGGSTDRAAHPLLRGNPGLADTVGSLLAPSTDQLMWGALAGVLTAPLYLAAVWHLYRGIRPAGRALAVPPAVALAASWAIAPFIHGSFYYWGEAYRAAESLGDDRAGVDRLLAMADDFSAAISVAYWVYGILVGLASLWIVVLIVRGRTAYPRWAVPASPGIGLLIGFAVAALLAGTVFQGAALSIGHLLTFTLSTILLWRRPFLPPSPVHP
ncbi:DUF6796 family protein [Amycolatopsis minnesotensis]|uniref:DUF4386 domain-containing protein n=1 Tax=Amycolatopsis minnesotensis TaxID=337894 RepID=A0ABN2RUB5_9PSEU